jgi:hypothetical protein
VSKLRTRRLRVYIGYEPIRHIVLAVTT